MPAAPARASRADMSASPSIQAARFRSRRGRQRGPSAGTSAVRSPASHFLIARMRQDHAGAIAAGIDPALTPLPAGYAQQTMLVVGTGIEATISAWGHALTDLAGKTRPGNDADAFLRRLSYW